VGNLPLGKAAYRGEIAISVASELKKPERSVRGFELAFYRAASERHRPQPVRPKVMSLLPMTPSLPLAVLEVDADRWTPKFVRSQGHNKPKVNSWPL
jgi:hypothetical protein